MPERRSTPIGEMWVDEDGLLWHRLSPDVSVDEGAAEATLEVILDLTEGRAMPAVVDIRGVAWATSDARDFFAQGMDRSPEPATAIIVGSRASEAIARLFMNISRPERPVRTFADEAEAAAWAKTFLGGATGG